MKKEREREHEERERESMKKEREIRERDNKGSRKQSYPKLIWTALIAVGIMLCNGQTVSGPLCIYHYSDPDTRNSCINTGHFCCITDSML